MNHPIVDLAKSLLNENSVILADKIVLKSILAKYIDDDSIIQLHTILDRYKDKLPQKVELPSHLADRQSFVYSNFQVAIVLTDNNKHMVIHTKPMESSTFYNLLKVIKDYNFKYNSVNKTWSRTYNVGAVYGIVKNISHLNVHLDTKIKEDITKIEENRRLSLEISQSIHSDAKVTGMKRELYSYQKVLIEYMTIGNRNSLLIADPMGAGKSAESLSVVMHKNLFPLLVICASGLKKNWEDEINKWIDKKAKIINGSKEEITREFDIYILNYELLEKYEEKILKFKFNSIMLDEGHAIKNPNSKRSKTAIKISNIPLKIIMTGTPIINRPVELVNQLKFLKVLDQFGGAQGFKNRYCDPVFDGYRMIYNGSSNIEEMQMRLRQICMVRREKKDISPELPEQVTQQIRFDLPDIAKYKNIEKNLASWYKEREGLFKSLSTDLDVSVREIYTEGMQKVNALKQAAIQYKLPLVKEWLNEVIEQVDKIVVFAFHRDIINSLHNHYGDNSLFIHGDNSKDAFDIINKFKNGKQQILLASLSVLSEGFNMQFCNYMAHIEFPWTWAKMDQSRSRIHRIGQKNTCFYYELIGNDTIDEDITKIIESKKDLHTSTTDFSVLSSILSRISDRNSIT